MSKWELDKSYPDLELLVGMSQLFETSVDHLLGLEEATETQKRSILDFFFQRKSEEVYHPSEKERKRMKKVCFVMYVSQGLNWVNASPYGGNFGQVQLIKQLKEELSPYYDLSFDPTTMEEEPDLLVIPERFKHWSEKNAGNYLILPMMLLFQKDYPAIKQRIDDYFEETQKGA
ncbi:hypothetical protein NRIC_10510 [Enterococcus florum]|uniref:HTH cro/C1-type domain-containing protein n=1 Tax=Enterococcus florum TaxID=2480627 RepID=A0A4P5P626_9ENTE|nr:hypothetical protein NRIC_10510 [Enterococcus florum]